MIINRYDDFLVTANFNVSEGFSKSEDAPESHFFDENLFYAAQHIRDVAGTAISFTSTYRTAKGNAIAGGAPSSFHKTGEAADLQPTHQDERTKVLAILYQDIKNQGPVFQKLFNDFGIRGFVFYDDLLHIDTRKNIFNTNYNGQPYMFLDKTTWLKQINVSISEPLVTGIIKAIPNVEPDITDYIAASPDMLINFLNEAFTGSTEDDGYVRKFRKLKFYSTYAAVILGILIIVVSISKAI